MKNSRIVALSCLIYQGVTVLVFGSADTIGPYGINSAILNLTGSGISIGQVEDNRPGLPAFDGASSHSSVVPAAIFEVTTGQGGLTPGTNTLNHAEQVAGIMISSDSTANGMAPGASLYSSAHLTNVLTTTAAFNHTMLTIQHIATQPNMRAVNHSWQKLPIPGDLFDGNSRFALGLDWSASTHDVLHVVAGFNLGQNTPIPKDNYNGMTIGISSKFIDGVYRFVDNLNGSPVSPPDGRTIIDLIAPGIDVRSTQLGNILTPPVPNTMQVDDGTSFAAPHVTGTVALLQQHAETRIGQTPEWNRLFEGNPTAHRHEVIKAVLMNSADKIEDTSGTGKYLGMERTVIKQDFNSTWFESEAFLEQETSFFDTPLDEEMGTGHLNAKRALQQFIPGEHEFNGNFGTPLVGDVPPIGWDYGTISGASFPINKYKLEGTLEAGQFFSATLAWDREVEFAIDADMDSEFDGGDTFEEYVNIEGVLTCTF